MKHQMQQLQIYSFKNQLMLVCLPNSSLYGISCN